MTTVYLIYIVNPGKGLAVQGVYGSVRALHLAKEKLAQAGINVIRTEEQIVQTVDFIKQVTV